MSQWNLRRRRARQLAESRPHAAALLAFYADVLTAQERLCGTASGADWPERLHSERDAEAAPALRLERLPASDLDVAFRTLIDGLAASDAATDLVREACRTLAGCEETQRGRLLQTVVGGDTLDDLASEIECSAPALELLGRSCLQPIAEAVSHQARRAPQHGSTLCAICGWPPQVAESRDDGDVRGARFLVCALCGASWAFARGMCPSCRESRPDQLDLHVAESLPHIRVESCRTCQTYLKSVDLRVDGFAVAQVDDIATVELDLWATAQGLTKLHASILGT